MKNITRQERQANTRQAILQTALNLIAEKGLDKLSLREIARRVEYSPAGLYEYFDGKEDILLTLAREGDDRLRAAIGNVSPNLHSTDYLIQVCLAFVDFALQNVEHFTVMTSMSNRRTSLNESIAPESTYLIFLKAVQAAIDEGELTAQDDFGVEEITYSFWALIYGMVMLRLSHLRNFKADFGTINRLTLEAFIVGLK